MVIEEIGGWVTVVGALVAAITGVWNLLLQMRGKRDRFVVRLGPVSPDNGQETMMHVVSHSDHPIKIADYGFIEEDGRFQSMRMMWATGNLHTDEITTVGSTDLASRGAVFEQGYIRRASSLGAFATSTIQTRPRICFDPGVPYWRRLKIRLRLLLVGSNYHP